MVKLFIPDILYKKDIHPVVYSKYPLFPENQLFYQEKVAQFSYSFEEVSTPAEADFIFVPHYFKALTQEIEKYLESLREIADQNNKKLIVSFFGDFVDAIDYNFPQTIVLKNSLYRSTKKQNEIMVPAFSEDLCPNGITVRSKQDKPTLSFCGQAGFKRVPQYLKYVYKCLQWNLQAFSQDTTVLARKPGIYFRRKALRLLKRSTKINSLFILRKTFSGHAKTVEITPEKARAEFVSSILNADFVLTPKGDGNYSNRFFEVLSAGRIPILIDTDTVLPFEDEIDYNSCVLRIDHTQIDQLENKILEFYNRLTKEEYTQMQHSARKIFQTYLRYDSFFSIIFSRIQEDKR